MATRTQIKTLFGGLEDIPPDADTCAVAESLIAELEDDADDEHYQVAAGYGDWVVTIGTSGLAVLDDLSWIDSKAGGAARPSLYLRLPSRDAAVSLLGSVLRGEVEAVRGMAWVPAEQLPPKTAQVFRQQRIIQITGDQRRQQEESERDGAANRDLHLQRFGFDGIGKPLIL